MFTWKVTTVDHDALEERLNWLETKGWEIYEVHQSYVVDETAYYDVLARRKRVRSSR
jgi:hypothetical protein